MSTIDPNSSQAALFAKLGISQTSETQKAKRILSDNQTF